MASSVSAPAPSSSPSPSDNAPKVDADASASSAASLKAQGNAQFTLGTLAGYRSSISLYSQAIALEPANPVYLSNRAAAWLMVGQLAKQPAALEACVKDVDAALALEGGSAMPKVHLRGAKAMVQLGRFRDAASRLKAGLAHCPGAEDLASETQRVEKIAILMEAGEAALTKREYTKAKRAFSEARGKDGAGAAATLGLARAALGLGESSVALSMTLEIIRADDANADAYYVRGEALYVQNNFDQAAKHFQQCLQMDPDHRDAQRAFKRTRKVDRLLASAKEQAAKRSFEDAAASLTEVLDLYGMANGAKTDGDAAADGVPPCDALVARCFSERANCLLRTKAFDECLKDCGNALYLRPVSSMPANDAAAVAPLLTRSTALQALGRHEEAVKDIESAFSLNREDNAIAGRLERAKFELKKSLRPNYYEMLGVSTIATTKEIEKGYKKAALKWHPDKFAMKSDEEKAEAEEYFKSLGEANEMLTDSARRALYDEGYDKEAIEERIKMQEMQRARYGGFGHGGGCGSDGCC